jgi:CRISPR-associated protein Csx17
MTHVHALTGCAPAPLAHYLKALGILRVVAEQIDPHARGWWQGDQFMLATSLDETALLDFLSQCYEPTPVLNPWGGRSGYFPEGSERAASNSLRIIESSESLRLARYRSVIQTARCVIAEMTGGRKPDDKEKHMLIAALRREARGGAEAWLNAVVAIIASPDGELVSEFLPIFGTGGNEGSGSYTSAYMAAVVECVVHRKWDHLVPSVLFASPEPSSSSKFATGQFFPEGIGQPWDLLLAVEGACLMRTAVSAKRAGSRVRSSSSPFTVRPALFGYASAARLDQFVVKQGTELFGRGEQWFPMWPQPALLSDLAQVLAEGRSSNGRRVATNGWSMARAVSSFGVRRGVSEFLRYGYLQRNNQSLHFAVPLGRFKVADKVSPLNSCFQDIDIWFDRLRSEANRKLKAREQPAAFQVSVRTLSEKLFDGLQGPNEPMRWQLALAAMASVETVMRTGAGFKAQPIPPLRPEWVTAADDGSPEFRLGLSFALQAADFHHGTGMPIDGIRRHWLPLDPRRAGRFATAGDAAHPRLAPDVDVVMQGRDGLTDAIALLERRLVLAAKQGRRTLPMQAARGAWAHPADLAAWVAGQVDPDRTFTLARALMALNRREWAVQRNRRISRPADPTAVPDDAFLVLRLAYLTGALPGGLQIPCDATILRRLASGDAATAVALALRRLRSAGLRCTVRAAAAPASAARLWAAALAFPIHPRTAQSFARRLDPTFAEEAFA